MQCNIIIKIRRIHVDIFFLYFLNNNLTSNENKHINYNLKIHKSDL